MANIFPKIAGLNSPFQCRIIRLNALERNNAATLLFFFRVLKREPTVQVLTFGSCSGETVWKMVQVSLVFEWWKDLKLDFEGNER